MTTFYFILIILMLIQIIILSLFTHKALRQRKNFIKSNNFCFDKTIRHKFDIIIAAKENPELVRNCLNSLLKQEFKNVFLCIDGGDEKIALEMRKQFPMFTIIYNPKSLGKIPSQIQCLLISQNKNILILDADITLKEDKINSFLRYFIKSDIDFLCPYSKGLYNRDSGILRDIAESDRYMRQRIVRAGRDAYGVSNLSGYCMLAKRDKYMDIIDSYSIQDDVSATLTLLKKKYKVRTYHEEICYEIERHNMSSYVLQKTRWTAGNLLLLKSYGKLFSNTSLKQAAAFASSFLLWYWSNWIDFVSFIFGFFYPPLFILLLIEGLIKYYGLKSVMKSEDTFHPIIYILAWPILMMVCLVLSPYYLYGKISERSTRR